VATRLAPCPAADAAEEDVVTCRPPRLVLFDELLQKGRQDHAFSLVTVSQKDNPHLDLELFDEMSR
jgi:hypothetical protein